MWNSSDDDDNGPATWSCREVTLRSIVDRKITYEHLVTQLCYRSNEYKGTPSDPDRSKDMERRRGR